jgi:hypothetical protein
VILIESLEEILEDPLTAGLTLSDELWDLHADEIVRNIHPNDAEEVAIHWPLERYTPYIEEILTKVATFSYTSYQALRHWSPERISGFEEVLARGMLKDLETCYEAGMWIIDYRWEKVSPIIVPPIAASDEFATRALINWDEDRIKPYEALFVEGITSSPKRANSASLTLEDRERRKYSDALAAKIIEDEFEAYTHFRNSLGLCGSHGAMLAGAITNSEYARDILHRQLNKERFDALAEVLIPVVAQNPEVAYELILKSNTEHVKPYWKRLAESIATDPKICFSAGMRFGEELFNQYGELFVRGVAQDLNVLSKAIIKWDNDKSVTLYLAEHPNPSNNYFEVDNKRAWVELIKKGAIDQFIGLSPQEFSTLSTAFEVTKQSGQLKLFFQHYKTVLEQGNIQQWSQTIIDGHKVGAVGGDTYRGVFNVNGS